MANLTETANWDANIYRIDQNDPVLGWDGSNNNIANLQAQALANRTVWLKTRVDLGPRLTDVATISSTGPVAATLFKGQLIRVNTSAASVVLTLPPLSSVGDNGNAIFSNEYGPNYNWLNSVNNDMSFIPAAGDSLIDLSTGETFTNGSTYQQLFKVGTVLHLHKIGANTWALYRLHESAQTPPGVVQAWAMNVPPSGWLECAGQSLIRAQFPNLFAVIGTTWGAPSGTTFSLPDLRGEFIRGWDNGRGIDSGRAFASAQSDLLKSHFHTMKKYNRSVGTGAGFFAMDDNGTDGSENTESTGGAETRPRNVAMMYCIKY